MISAKSLVAENYGMFYSVNDVEHVEHEMTVMK